MIQDILPHELNNQYKKQAPRPSDYVFCFSQGKVLLLRQGTQLVVPTYHDVDCEETIWLFTIDDKGVFLGQNVKARIECSYENLTILRHFKPQELAFAGMTAWHLYSFYKSHQFCGECRTMLEFAKDERAMKCPHCGHMSFPQISPAVIVGIIDGDRILLTKYASNHSSYKKYALVAGYTEIGETLEQTVSREVYEEVGLKVKNITYYKNQPWGLSGSLLVGFFAKVDGSTEIKRDEDELSVAEWVSRDAIEISEDAISLTRDMMECFRNDKVEWGTL